MTWEELYRHYSDKIYNFILLMVGNIEVAEDLTHDTFVNASKSLSKFKGESSYYTWLVAIARNVTYDYLRRKKKISFLTFDNNYTFADNQTPEELLIKEEDAQELFIAIQKLKLNYKEVIIMRKIQELSIEETSIVLGWSISKVKTTLNRAIYSLKQELIKDTDIGGKDDERREST